jgi:hypothetical protein
MPVWLLQLLPILLGTLGSAGARRLLSGAAAKTAGSALRGAAGRALPTALKQGVAERIAAMSPKARSFAGGLGGIGKDVAQGALIDAPIFMGSFAAVDRLMQQPAQVHGANSLMPTPVGGDDQLSRLLADVAGQIDSGDLESLELEQLIGRLGGLVPQQRRLI